MPVLYTIGMYTAGPAIRVLWRPKVEGLEHVPATGGAIFAGNHLSVADEFILGAVVPRPIAFWAKEDYFNGTGVSGLFFKGLMNGLGAIPVHRAGGRAALSAFDEAIPHLQNGGLVCVYPEGTRSPDGRLYRGRTGAARLAMAAGVPIVPVGFIGTEKIQPIGQVLPSVKRDQVTIKFAKPIDVTEWNDAESQSTAAREITDQLMRTIQQLTGQHYVSRYAPKKDD
ncbi:lysophospholipid acyltransferase family protein [Catelliglobosispora koreensis]|uniref:lysophospholipid acyltransferase family protein n=1 Tax=Catelliglobosispora koreensis TaxID=129052 RepID=UPI00037F7461|nr:lysophospholipid acyltransferase family protein [Catelliglobosispora koreensis]